MVLTASLNKTPRTLTSWTDVSLEKLVVAVLIFLAFYGIKNLSSLTQDGARSALSQIVVLFYVLFVLCRSVYCLCVNVYCTTATGWQPNCSYKYVNINTNINCMTLTLLLKHINSVHTFHIIRFRPIQCCDSEQPRTLSSWMSGVRLPSSLKALYLPQSN